MRTRFSGSVQYVIETIYQINKVLCEEERLLEDLKAFSMLSLVGSGQYVYVLLMHRQLVSLVLSSLGSGRITPPLGGIAPHLLYDILFQ